MDHAPRSHRARAQTGVRRLLGVGFATALAVGMVGCSPAPNEPDASSGPASATSLADALRPLPPAVSSAWGDAVATCMKREGFTYEPSDLNPVTTSDNLLGVAALDPASAKNAQGYGFTQTAAAAPETTSDAFLSALYGAAGPATPTADNHISIAVEGCAGEANQAIYRDISAAESAFNLQSDFLVFVNERLDAEPPRDMLATLADYGDCMQAAGVDVTAVDDTFALAQERYSSPNRSATDIAAERDLLAADLACETKVRYVERFDTATIALAADWIEQHRDVLSDALQWRNQVVEAASAATQ